MSAENHLLSALSDEARARLCPYLELVSLAVGDTVRHVYFPTDATVSLLYVLQNGASAEISVVGNEGLVGITLYLGGETTPSRAIVQTEGSAYRLPRPKLREEFNSHGELPRLVLRYASCLTTQMAQTATCNRYHTLEQRLCRWLLLSLDRLSGNAMTMTQELIACMLGVDREEIARVAGMLQKLGVIQHSRGRLTVLDRPKLELLACECYGLIKTETDRLFCNAHAATVRINERSTLPVSSAA